VRRSISLTVYSTIAAIIIFAGCAAAEPRPAGVSRLIHFSVTAVYPKSFDIIASVQWSIYGHFGIAELKEAWRKKALQLANGRKFKSSALVVHDGEDSTGGWAIGFRSVSGTITLTD
jgi:hypothetical protein